ESRAIVLGCLPGETSLVDSRSTARTMAYRRVGHTWVVVQGRDGPRPAEWNEYIAELEASVPDVRGVLVFSGGGSLNARQRQQVEKLFSGTSTLTPVLSDSLLVRGVVTALGWFNVQIRSFSPQDIAGALEYLRVPEHDRATVSEALAELKRRVL